MRAPHEIVAVDAIPLDLPLTEPFAIAGGAPSIAANVLVRVHLAGGLVGLGEAAPFEAVSGETQTSTLAALSEGARCLVHHDVRALRPLAAALGAAIPEAAAARAALEMALFDAFARLHGLPLWAHFGGAGRVLETDMTITAGDVEHARRSAVAIAARGIQTLKIKVGALRPEEDAARVVAAAAGAPGLRLYADANGGYDVDGARRFVATLAAEGIALALFEQPVPRADRAGLLELARSLPMPVCADESARSAEDVLALARSGVPCAVNLKVMKSGVVETCAMAAIARAAGLPLMIGGMVESCLAMSFSAHLAAGLGGFSFVDLDTPYFVANSPFRGGFEERRGVLTLDPVAPGHGVSEG
jgi:L-alanine-DL-glutamate epimerase-like enolase superfamily enzyme